jgi:hypothetical protein
MSSIVEKLLMIALGAIICLNLFSMIIPIINNLDSSVGSQNPNPDVTEFYNLLTKIQQAETQAQESPGTEIEIDASFTTADSLYFVQNDNMTLTIQLSFDNEQISEAISFQSYIELFQMQNEQENESDFILVTKSSSNQIQISFFIVLSNGILDLIVKA